MGSVIRLIETLITVAIILAGADRLRNATISMEHKAEDATRKGTISLRSLNQSLGMRQLRY